MSASFQEIHTYAHTHHIHTEREREGRIVSPFIRTPEKHTHSYRYEVTLGTPVKS